jgi:hypothetical protein
VRRRWTYGNRRWLRTRELRQPDDRSEGDPDVGLGERGGHRVDPAPRHDAVVVRDQHQLAAGMLDPVVELAALARLGRREPVTAWVAESFDKPLGIVGFGFDHEQLVVIAKRALYGGQAFGKELTSSAGADEHRRGRSRADVVVKHALASAGR